MNDLISRQAAIDGVKRLSLGETDATRLAMRTEDYMERLQSAQPEQRWISCSEMLPEVNTIVLATTADFMYIVEFEVYSNGHMHWNEVNEYRSIEDVIAWMPLPEPYKGEEA